MVSEIKNPNSNTIYSRQVYILIDQGSGMDKIDTGMSLSRWELIAENVQGDMNNMMRDRVGHKVCDEVSIHLFSRNRVGQKIILDKHSSFRRNVIEENYPDTNRFITRTLESCLQDWQQRSQQKKSPEKAFIVIYTSGIFHDFKKFNKRVLELNNDFGDYDAIKIIVIGVGGDFEESHVISRMLKLYFSQKKSYIFFVESTSQMTGIMDLLETSINITTGDFIPQWVRNRYPDLCRQYSQPNPEQSQSISRNKRTTHNCPRCGSQNYIKNGYLVNKNERKQRLKCKDCRRNYLEKYNN